MQKRNRIKHLKKPLLFMLFFITHVTHAEGLSAADQAFIIEQQQNAAKVAAPYKNTVTELAKKAQENTSAFNAPADKPLEKPAIASLQTVPEIKNNANTGQILIFVSSSMPETSLKQWLNQANQIHAAVIIRGLVGESLISTQQWVQSLLPSQEATEGIQLNPVAFETYQITQVPAVVASQLGDPCPTNMSCLAPPYDVVYGNVSLAAALKTLAEQGESANGVAAKALTVIQENE